MMKYIIKNTLEEAEELNVRINNALYASISRYNAIKWCEITINKANDQFAVVIEEIGPRADVINSILTETEIPVEISRDDRAWFDEPTPFINPE